MVGVKGQGKAFADTLGNLFYFCTILQNKKSMGEKELHDLVYSRDVVEFVTVAREFCERIEQVNLMPVKENMDKIRKILPLLYLKGSLLPRPEKVFDEELEKYVSELDYNVWQQRWLRVLGEYDSYYEVFDPGIQFGEETVTASISESLMDIYQDLKDFLTAYSLGDEAIMNDALSDCVYHFEDFWGQRLVNVLRAMHKLFVDDIEYPIDKDPEDEKDIKKNEGKSDWVNKFWDSHTDEE
jgi:hypothetical protein